MILKLKRFFNLKICSTKSGNLIIIFGSFSFFGNQIPFIVLWLVFASLYFSFYFRFVNIFYFKRALNVAFGKYDDPSHPGEITHFQSFTAAMSGTIGLGNIAGVAVAISIGGPGAMLWMIITAFFGMTLKFVEVSLGPVSYTHLTLPTSR